MAHAGVVTLSSIVVVVFGCGGSGGLPAAEPDARRGLPAESIGSFQGTRWGTFHSKRFELSLGLPDGGAWKIDDHRTAWLRATHASTRSSFSLRSWTEDMNVTRKSCYARARTWEPGLPDLEGQLLIDDKVRVLLGTHDARVAVGVDARADPDPVTGGFVVAIVGDIRRCVVVAFETETRGAAAQDEVADRLAIVADRVLPSMKLDQSFTPSREPVMPPPAGPGGTLGGR
jgi:hypothetical protein